jgi:F-type H+-transporting ATPase subunit b
VEQTDLNTLHSTLYTLQKDGDSIVFHLAEFHIPFSPFDIEEPEILISLLIGFVLLVWALWKVNLPYVSRPYFRDLLQDRTSRIEADKNAVDRALADVEQVRSDYAARLQRIEEEARERIDAAVREAESARAEIIAEALETAQALLHRSEEEIARESTRQRILFRQQVVQTALDAAEKSVRAHSPENVQHQLIGDFITLAAGQGANAVPILGAAPDTPPTSTQGGA